MMMNHQKLCPKCQTEMARGFVPDYSRGAILVGNWQDGHPEKSFWSRTKAPLADGIPIAAFRCPSCCFLEFYAGSKFAAQ